MKPAGLHLLIIVVTGPLAAQEPAVPRWRLSTANGLMFGGAYLGQAIGGAGVLYLIPFPCFDRIERFCMAYAFIVSGYNEEIIFRIKLIDEIYDGPHTAAASIPRQVEFAKDKNPLFHSY